MLLLADSPGRRETMHDFLAEYELRPAPAASYEDFRTASAPFMLGVGSLHTGFAMGDAFALITENELYATQARNRSAREARKTTAATVTVDGGNIAASLR